MLKGVSVYLCIKFAEWLDDLDSDIENVILKDTKNKNREELYMVLLNYFMSDVYNKD